ncbi:MAG: peptidoglycan-binding protein [Myxococcaceae bacterium]
MLNTATQVSSKSYAFTSSPPTLRFGSKGSSVVTLQNKLRALGFNPGPSDGVFGNGTLAAVKAFQHSRGLSADGVVGPNTWGKLNVSAPAPSSSGGSGPTLREGMKGNPVKQLQSRLNALGFHCGSADGDFGPKTAAAVKAFQHSRGLTADGVVGPHTWNKLGIHASGSVSGGGVSSGGGGGSVTNGYVNGVPHQIHVKSIPNGKVMRSDAADAYNRMYAAARASGVTLTPVSGFRTMAEQQYLYSLYLQGKGNLAAKPGYSNHQSGIAVDISVGSTASSAYHWLAVHGAAYGFRRTVPSEPWHWEYRP